VAVVFGKPIPSSGRPMESRDDLVAEQRTGVEEALREARELVSGDYGARRMRHLR
jgi:hypothetical protein